MKLVFNTKNITEVGIKIYFDDNLLKEIELKRTLFFQEEVEITVEKPGKLQLQLVDINDLKSPEKTIEAHNIAEKMCIEEKLDDCFSGTTAMGFRYPYKTVFYEISTNIDLLYFQFVSLEDMGVTAVIAKTMIADGKVREFDGTQYLVRVPDMKSLKLRRAKMWMIIALLAAFMVMATAYLLSSVLQADFSNTFEGQSWIALVAFISLALFIPVYVVYFRTRGAYELLKKCDCVPVNDYKTEFISKFYEESQDSDADV